MRLLFLIPLSIGIIVSYFSRNIDDEIAYLTNIITILNFGLSLIIAPWQIQLLILIILLLTIRKIFPKNELDNNLDNLKVETAKLDGQNEQTKYRGVSYTIQNTVKSSSKGKIIGKYRGQDLHDSNISENLLTPNQSDNQYNLKYRGVNINKNKS